MSNTRGRPAAGTSQDYQPGYPEAGYPEAGYPPQQGYPAGEYRGQRVTYSGGGGAKAGSVLAGVLMILVGIYSFLAGLAMVTKQTFFTYHAGYAYHWTTVNWGWTQLGLGIVVFLAGICVLLGMVWARMVGVVLATLSAVSSFLVLPYYPIWSIAMIVVDVFLIWALVKRGRQVRT